MVKANISWVTPTLATGGDLSYDPTKAADQMQDIIDQKVSLIIDCRDEATDDELWEAAGIDYLYLPTFDSEGHHIPWSLFDEAVDEARLVIDQGGRVLAHCHMGVNRGPSVAYAILLEQGMDTIEAFALIRSKRRQAAIAYAEDALLAHMVRNDYDPSAMQRELDRLTAHVRSIWTPRERERIERIVRAGHDDDYATLVLQQRE